MVSKTFVIPRGRGKGYLAQMEWFDPKACSAVQGWEMQKAAEVFLQPNSKVLLGAGHLTAASRLVRQPSFAQSAYSGEASHYHLPGAQAANAQKVRRLLLPLCQGQDL